MNTQLAFDIRDVFHPPRFIPDYRSVTGFGTLASDIIWILTVIVGVVAMIFIVLSGFKFVTSGGDPKKLAGAQSTLTYAIIGIVVTILAFVILQVVQYMVRSTVPVT